MSHFAKKVLLAGFIAGVAVLPSFAAEKMASPKMAPKMSSSKMSGSKMMSHKMSSADTMAMQGLSASEKKTYTMMSSSEKALLASCDKMCKMDGMKSKSGKMGDMMSMMSTSQKKTYMAMSPAEKALHHKMMMHFNAGHKAMMGKMHSGKMSGSKMSGSKM